MQAPFGEWEKSDLLNGHDDCFDEGYYDWDNVTPRDVLTIW